MRGGGRKPGRGRGKGNKMIPASPVRSEAEEEEQPEEESQPVSDDDSEMVEPSQNVPSESDPNIDSEASDNVDTEASQPIQATQSQPIQPTQSQSEPTQAGGTKGKETRKKRPLVTITQAQEDTAVEFLKRHEVLYNR